MSRDDKDFHLAIHESSHALVGVCLNGPGQIELITIEPGRGFLGRVEGVRGDEALVGLSPSDVCNVAKTFWPGRFEARGDCADFFLHSVSRVTELLAGTIGEQILAKGQLLPAPGDQAQAVTYARLLCTSPQSITAFLAFAAAEARALIEANKSVILELAAALQAKRTIKGPEVDRIVAVALARQDLEVEHRRRAEWARVAERARNFEAAHRVPRRRKDLPAASPGLPTMTVARRKIGRGLAGDGRHVTRVTRVTHLAATRIRYCCA